QMALADMRTRIQLARWAYLNAALAFDNSVGSTLQGVAMKSVKLIPKGIRSSDTSRRFFLSNAGKTLSDVLIAISTSPDEASHALAFASMAKAVGGDTAMYVSSLALQLMGMDGGEERRWVEKAFRDAKLTQIYEGTNQLNRLTLFMADIEKSLKVELKNPFSLKAVGKGVG
ncbi:MAG: hypothetical protein MUO75_00900, partial [Actinobacteria bacterium]|nr:hypothetical protein [Actinomycetota bacterium]